MWHVKLLATTIKIVQKITWFFNDDVEYLSRVKEKSTDQFLADSPLN
jgi:hypothetical protein